MNEKQLTHLWHLYMWNMDIATSNAAMSECSRLLFRYEANRYLASYLDAIEELVVSP